jgi:MFS family permease
MNILLLVPFGILSDRIGRRPMILYPRMIMLVGTFIRAIATDPIHLILASIVGGFAGGSYFPILLSMIADVAKPGEQRKSISILFFFSSIGMVIGPLISTLLLTLTQISLRNIYQITVVAEIGIIIYLATQIKETKPPIKENKTVNFLPSISTLLRKKEFQTLLIMSFLYFFNLSIINTYMPIYGRIDLNLSAAEVASFSSFRSLAIMLIRFSSVTYLTKIPIKIFLIFLLALNGITGLASPFAQDYFTIVLLLFMTGISFGAVRILSTTLVAKSSTHENRGIANSLLDVGQATGNFTKILTSPIADSLGLSPVFILGGFVGLLSIIPILVRKID